MSYLQKVKAAAVRRVDGWFNEWTGLGTARDRATYTYMARDPWIDDETLSALYNQDDLAQTIVSIYPEEALSRGWIIPDAPASEALKALRARDTIEEAATWGRLYGGCVVVVGTDDPAPAREPLPPGKWCVRYLAVYDKREVFREDVFSDPAHSDYGKTNVFRVTPTNGRTFYVHRSRCLIFGGKKTPKREREELHGWDASVLQAIYPVLRDFGSAYLAISNMLTDASQGVLRMKGLVAAMTGEEQQVIKDRLALIDLSRSVARSIFLDSDGAETYEKLTTTFAGVPDIADRFANRLAAATRIPVTILMGQAPAGLNATGEADMQAWFKRVAAYRTHEIEPQIKRLLEILGHPGVEIGWPAFVEETDTQKAARRKTEAEIDKIYATDIGAVAPEEVFETARVRALYPHANAALRQATPAARALAAADDEPVRAKFQGNAELAAAMTSWIDPETGKTGKRHCEHGLANRCRYCGVERTRQLTPQGQWVIAWRAYGE